MRIKTNNRRIPIISGYDLPEKARAEFDYSETSDELEQASFFKYKGQYWDLSQFTKGGPAGWDGCYALTVFSGILVKLVGDGDSVIVAYCYE